MSASPKVKQVKQVQYRRAAVLKERSVLSILMVLNTFACALAGFAMGFKVSESKAVYTIIGLLAACIIANGFAIHVQMSKLREDLKCNVVEDVDSGDLPKTKRTR